MAAIGEFDFNKDPADSWKCLICLEVAEKPKQHDLCGRLFCTKCIEKNGNNPCPNCRAANPRYFLDTKSCRDIREMHEKGGIAEREYMMKQRVGLVPCPNACMDDGECVHVKRKDLESHKKKCPNREYECKRCGEKAIYSMKKDHDNVCTKKLVKCPNLKCSSILERDKVEEHFQTVCSYTEVRCKYEHILGCVEIMTRKHMKQHEQDDKAHLLIGLGKLQVTQTSLDAAVERIDVLQNELASAQRTIEGLTEGMQQLEGRRRRAVAQETIRERHSTTSASTQDNSSCTTARKQDRNCTIS